jgi:plasmid stabilization system protein ParE
MSHALIIRRRAEHHMAEAGLWYESRRAGTAVHFIRCVDAAISLITRHPEAGPVQFGPFRRVLVSRFPFGVFYTVESGTVIVHGVFHASQDPDKIVTAQRMSISSISPWDSIDQFSEAFPTYNCAFLDILGYKQKADAFFDQRFNLYGRVNRAISNVYAALQQNARFPITSGLTIEIFSDSIIMMQPPHEFGLGIIMLFASHLARMLSLEDLLIRGGIAQGRHFRRKTDDGFDFLASEALIKAHILESEKAVYPRVLIDEDLIDKLLPDERKILIRENNDAILHFFDPVINGEGTNPDHVHALMRKLQTDMNQESDDKVKLKYLWLLDYYYWTISTNPNWDANAFRGFHSGMIRRFAKFE